MTKQEAKELSLEVWRYLAEHPELRTKENLPNEIFYKIRFCEHYCPLCDLFKKQYECNRCPLVHCMDGSYYSKWYESGYGDNEIRKEAAQKIVDAIQAWKPEGRHEEIQD